MPLTVPTYNGPPEPGLRSYQLADYPDALAAFRQGVPLMAVMCLP